MKKLFVCSMAVGMLIFATMAIAGDAPYPMADPQGRGQLVAEEAVLMGSLDPDQPIYALRERPDKKASGWMPDEGKLMRRESAGGETYFLAEGIARGQRFHPAQVINGEIKFLEIESAHGDWFKSAKVTKTERGNICYLGQ